MELLSDGSHPIGCTTLFIFFCAILCFIYSSHRSFFFLFFFCKYFVWSCVQLSPKAYSFCGKLSNYSSAGIHQKWGTCKLSSETIPNSNIIKNCHPNSELEAQFQTYLKTSIQIWWHVNILLVRSFTSKLLGHHLALCNIFKILWMGRKQTGNTPCS